MGLPLFDILKEHMRHMKDICETFLNEMVILRSLYPQLPGEKLLIYITMHGNCSPVSLLSSMWHGEECLPF